MQMCKCADYLARDWFIAFKYFYLHINEVSP